MTNRWAIFISGVGSNLGAALDLMPAIDIAVVVSSKATAPGLLKARSAGVPTLCLDKEIDWSGLDRSLRAYGVNAIFLAGFMKILPGDFLARWQGQVLNVHPSLLPKYPGLNSIERAWRDRQTVGVTIHEVIPEVDAGRILMQREVGWYEDREEMFFQTHLVEHQMVRKVMVEWKHNPMP